MKTTSASILVASLLALLSTAPAARADYPFILIADSSDVYFGSMQSVMPSLNAAGMVSFYAHLETSFESGIFRGNGGAITTVALNTGPKFSGFGTLTGIDELGRVEFGGALQSGGNGIFTGIGGATTDVALSTGPTFSGFGGISGIRMGTVAFYATLDAGGEGIHTGDGNPPTTVVSTGAIYSAIRDITALNAAGRVVFGAERQVGDNGIFSIQSGVTTEIATSSGGLFLGFGNPMGLNLGGTTSFIAYNLAFEGGLYTGNGGTPTLIASEADPLYGFLGPFSSINSAGTVAFTASLEAGGFGIFVGDGGLAVPVISTGDVLNGSTVTELYLGNSALNDLGQVAFGYTLANGVTGVAVAGAPEPASAGLLALGALGLLGRRRRG